MSRVVTSAVQSGLKPRRGTHTDQEWALELKVIQAIQGLATYHDLGYGRADGTVSPYKMLEASIIQAEVNRAKREAT